MWVTGHVGSPVDRIAGTAQARALSAGIGGLQVPTQGRETVTGQCRITSMLLCD